MRTSRWLPLVLVTACLLLGADDAPAPPADAPRSAEAKQAMQAMQAYEKATLEARKVFDDALAKARKKGDVDLTKAMDKAMERRDLEEANRIKAQVASADEPKKGETGTAPDLFGKKWRRFMRRGHSDATMQFMPDGTIRGDNTAFAYWRRSGDGKILLSKKPGGEGTEYELRPSVPVLYTSEAPAEGSVLIPEAG